MRQFFCRLMFVSILFSSSLWAQPTEKALFDVAMLSPDTVIVVGRDGTLLRTLDGGETWTSQINSAKTFTAVYFVDKSTGWVVGDDGVIRKTTNSGKKWLRQPLNAPNLKDVFFINKEIGWAVGIYGTIANTIDGDESWEIQPSGTRSQLESIHFFDADTGWAVGRSSTIIKTINGGATWNTMLTGNSKLLSVFFTNAILGWAVGFSPDVLFTSDGGNNWLLRSTTPRTEIGAGTVFFSDSLNGWIAGTDAGNFDDTGIIATTDGGITWHRQLRITNTDLLNIHFMDTQNGWAVGDAMYKTSDGGQTWQQVGGVLVGVEEHKADLPLTIDLSQNYPNPFSLTQAANNRQAQTTIAYELADAAHVNLTVYDILGRAVRTLVNKENPAGAFHISWNGRDQANRRVANGIYFYRMQVQAINGSEPLVKQMKIVITD